MTPRVTLIGRNNTWAAPMTDAQRELAEPAFHDEHSRPWTAWRVVGEAAGIIAVFAAIALLWCVL